MRKALLTGTAVIALGMFGYGIASVHAAPFPPTSQFGGANAQNGQTNIAVNANGDLNGNDSHNNDGGNLSHDLNGAQLNGNGNSGRAATVGENGTATSNSQNNSGRSATANGSNSSANSNSGDENFGAQGLLFGSEQVGNGVLANVASNNHVDVTVTLASSSAGGKLIANGGSIENQSDNRSFTLPGGGDPPGGPTYQNNNESIATNAAFGSVGVITQVANGNGIQQANTSVAIGAVDSGATLVSR